MAAADWNDYAMNICGFQKLTLLDFPGKVACTIFTGGCNFRCSFCHNASLVTGEHSEEERISGEEILQYLAKRKGLLDGVCVTGGEPLLQPDLPDFLREIRALGFSVKLDTNGSFPDRLAALAEEGLLDYVAMDIKNCREKYGQTAGECGLRIESVEDSVAFLKAGRVDFEFRTTVVAEFHTLRDIEAIGAWIQGAPRYFLQNFVDSGNLLRTGLHAVPKETMLEMKRLAAKFVPDTQLRGL